MFEHPKSIDHCRRHRHDRPVIDLTLEQGVQNGVWTKSEISVAASSMRAAKKLAMRLALKSAAPTLPERPGAAPATEMGGLEKLASSILEAQSNTTPLSRADEKIVEELQASKDRLHSVAKDPKALEALIALVFALACIGN